MEHEQERNIIVAIMANIDFGKEVVNIRNMT